MTTAREHGEGWGRPGAGSDGRWHWYTRVPVKRRLVGMRVPGFMWKSACSRSAFDSAERLYPYRRDLHPTCPDCLAKRTGGQAP